MIRDFKRIIAKSRKAAAEEHIHLLWYCMDAGQTRVQDYDVDIIRALAEDVPVVLVFTQTIDDDARRRPGRRLFGRWIRRSRVVSQFGPAEARRIGGSRSGRKT